MAKRKLTVTPVGRKKAREICAGHPHAGTLPNSSKYYMMGYLYNRPVGLAVWGYGIVPKGTPKHLFGDAGNVNDYLELCRFFVYDWCPPNTASQFLAATHRIIKKHAPQIKWLYTYAAGFQGMVGYIYKATGYDYIGRTLCQAFMYIPGVGLIHSIAQWHRWGKQGLKHLKGIFPDAKIWCGYNFRYIFWLCDKKEKAELIRYARFGIQPYPTEEDIEIWTEDVHGKKTPINPAFAKTVPIVKLRSKRHPAEAAQVPLESGGATPTVTLQENYG